MFRRLIAAAALAFALSGLAAGPVAAGPLTADCVWNNITPAKRASLLSDYRTKGMQALKLSFEDGDLDAVPVACGVTDARTAAVAGSLIVAVMLEKGSTATLVEQFSVSENDLPTAWAALGPDSQRTMIALAKVVITGKAGAGETEAARPIVESVLARLNLSGPDAMMQVAAYLLGRAIRAGAETP